MTEKTYFVYIMASRKNGTIYIGVTNDLPRRAFEHFTGQIAGFTRKYKVKYLVFYESFREIEQAIAREKYLKGLMREKKLALIEDKKPLWLDLRPSL